MAQGVVFQDAAGRIEMANPAAERILGLSLDQMQGKTSADPEWRSIHEDGSPFPGEEHPAMEALRTGREVNNVLMGVFHSKTNAYRWIRVDAVPLFRAGEQKPFRVYAMFTDEGEKSTIESVQEFLTQRGWTASGEDFFRSLARFLARTLSADYICIDRLEGDGLKATTVAVYSDGDFEDNSTYTLKDTPCGKVVEKSICCFPASVRELFPQDIVLQEMAAESYAGTTLWSGDGRKIGLIAIISRKPMENPRLAELVLNLVSARAAGELERREASAALRKLVEQKETLLKELQHRVKNNLNVVSSLLELETGRLPDQSARDIFIQTRNRIASISSIYERLYLSEDLETVDLGSYIESLAASIFAAYEIDQGRIKLDVSGDQIHTNTKKTVPLGLILNELISNSLKYAFPGNRKGRLKIRLAARDGSVALTVEDDGVGYPKSLDPSTSDSMGLSLVRLLADELRAQLRFEPAAGVRVALDFPL